MMADLNFKRDKPKLATRPAFKNFCRVLDSDSDELFELHCMIFSEMFDIWERARVRDPSLFLTDFGSCKKLLEDKVKYVYQKGGV